MLNQWTFPMIGLFVLLTITKFCMTSWKLESMVRFIKSNTESWNYEFWSFSTKFSTFSPFFQWAEIFFSFYCLIKINSYIFLTLKQRSGFGRSIQNFVKIIQNSQIQDWLFHLMNMSKDLRKRPLMKTISPAIDILVSSNLERHLWMHLGDNGVKAFLKSHA